MSYINLHKIIDNKTAFFPFKRVMNKIWLTGFIFCLPFLPVWIFSAKYDLLNGFLLEIFWLFFCRGILCYWEPGREGKNSNCTHSGLYDPKTRWHAAKTSLQKYICVFSVLSRLFQLTFFVLKAGEPSRSCWGFKCNKWP